MEDHWELRDQVESNIVKYNMGQIGNREARIGCKVTITINKDAVTVPLLLLLTLRQKRFV